MSDCKLSCKLSLRKEDLLTPDAFHVTGRISSSPYHKPTHLPVAHQSKAAQAFKLCLSAVINNRLNLAASPIRPPDEKVSSAFSSSSQPPASRLHRLDSANSSVWSQGDPSSLPGGLQSAGGYFAKFTIKLIWTFYFCYFPFSSSLPTGLLVVRL